MTKPILFNTDMVRALLEGRKTVTRRAVKPQPRLAFGDCSHGCYTYRGIPCGIGRIADYAPYRLGDILYVRETWAAWSRTIGTIPRILYKADRYTDAEKIKWHPSIHMPREVARIFLRVTDVRVERLWAVEAEDVLAEGVTPIGKSGGCRCQWAFDGCMDGPCSNRTAYEIERYIVPFAQLWDSTIKPADRAIYGWDANPWVWVIEFERCEKPEEKVEPC